MPLNIHRQLLVLKVALTRPLDQMHMHHALAQRSFYVKFKAHVLSAPPICLLRAADIAIPRQSRPRGFAECCDFGTGAEQRGAAFVGADEGDGAVEVGGFGGGGEDVGEEEVTYAAL